MTDGLPPRDKGRQAWSILLAVSLMLTLTWGFGSCFGVFREYYFHHEPLAGNQLVVSTGVIQIGILQISPPFLLRYLSAKPAYRKGMMWLGMIMVVSASIGAAFSTTPVGVIMTQGVLYGIGSGLLFAPSISFIDEWFLLRRGIANGIFFGSNNLAAAACSPIFSIVLQKFGSRTVLIAWAIIAGVGISLGILFVRPRVPQSSEGSKTSFSWQPFRRPRFYIFALSMFLQGLANFLPAAYLPSYSTDIGLSLAQGSLLITFLSLSGMIGQSLLGLLTDKIGAQIPLLLSTLVSTFAVFVLWGFGSKYWMLVILAVLFGAFSFSFAVVRSHMASAVVGDSDHPNEETVVSAALLAVRGIACVASGYTGAAVVASSENMDITPGYGAGKWLGLIIYVGVFMFGASIGAVGLRTTLRRKKVAPEAEMLESSGCEAQDRLMQ
ncbi:major facilitator superfamily domain-containing protein [Truncatella angustata]|uniref:Major facilitator superfamily domain-containing protein n=1 Tax=Truncatella angustata TaxID=152316 RepID=A0A9P8RMJ7_9PEZI|nr:major facilitator superfamily domain-containing protein [Truncatella angustata]KAH6646771.1 major facilitator superfamily domain-containing protein [Truncatella angustata]